MSRFPLQNKCEKKKPGTVGEVWGELRIVKFYQFRIASELSMYSPINVALVITGYNTGIFGSWDVLWRKKNDRK